MADQTDKNDIGSQLDRFGQLLNELPEGRREAFFKWIEEADPTPPVGKSAPQVAPASGLPSHGAIRLLGPRRTTSVALSEPLKAALKQYATDQGIRLSMSAIVELLIWQFLGQPRELIQEVPIPRRPRSASMPDEGPTQADILAQWTELSVNKIIEEPNDTANNEDTQKTD